jgi:20S proteasome alpha/beta subunit
LIQGLTASGSYHVSNWFDAAISLSWQQITIQHDTYCSFAGFSTDCQGLINSYKKVESPHSSFMNPISISEAQKTLIQILPSRTRRMKD